jgi:hypothetical protein
MKTAVRIKLVPLALALSLVAVLGQTTAAHAAPTATVTWFQKDTSVSFTTPWGNCWNITLPWAETVSVVGNGHSVRFKTADFSCEYAGHRTMGQLFRNIRYDANGFTTARYELYVSIYNGGGQTSACGTLWANSRISQTITGPRPKAIYYPSPAASGTGFTKMTCGLGEVVQVYFQQFETLSAA